MHDMRRLMTLCEAQGTGFDQWFAGSRVVDSAGKPLMVYHGTSRESASFKPMTHFGTHGAAQDRLYDLSRKGSIIGVYLSIKKPVPFRDNGWQHDPAALLNDLHGCWRMYQDSHLEEADIDEALARLSKVRSFGPIIRFLKTLGYDGLQYENNVEDRGSTSWAIFDAKQVWRVR